MRKLIITADDFGLSKSVNDAIEECIKSNVIKSTNIMVNMPLAIEAKNLKSKYKNISIGIHFNFTVGKPLSPIYLVKNLVNEEGEFLNINIIQRQFKKNKISIKEFEVEMLAQYNKFVETLGCVPDYWNVHENVHVTFGLYKKIAKIAKSIGITKMRSQERIIVYPFNGERVSLKNKFKHFIKKKIIKLWQKKIKTYGIYSPSGMIVCLNINDKLNFELICKNVKWDGIMEITAHPATKNDSEFFGSITEFRTLEYNHYLNSKLLNIARKYNVEIVSFEEV